jgi:hypothetical protein
VRRVTRRSRAVEPASRESTRTTANELSSAERLLDHAGVLVIVVSAVGYVVGYVSVWLFALGLGAVPRDLGLGQREYVLLGAVWSLLLICYGLASLVAAAGDLPYGRFMLVQAYLGLIWVTLALPLSPPIGLLSLTVVLVVGSVLALYVVRRNLFRRPLRRFIVYANATALLGVFVAAGYFSWGWGDHVRHEPASLERAGPIALSLAVPVTEGQVTLGRRDVCVVRVSERVFVTKAKVLIEAEPRAFRPGDCF